MPSILTPIVTASLFLVWGKEIMAPEFLKTYQPDKVIIMNAIYQEEISKMLEDMGVTTELVAL